MCGCTSTASPAAAARQLDAALHLAGRQAPAASGRRRARFRPAPRGAANRQPARQRLERRRAHRHDARLRALAGDADLARARVDGADVEAGELRDPQPARIRQLEERAVADAGIGGVLDGDQARRVVGRERLRQRARRARRAHALARIGGDLAVPHQPVEEPAPRRQQPRERARRESPAVQRRDEAADVRGAQLARARARPRGPRGASRRGSRRSSVCAARRRSCRRKSR